MARFDTIKATIDANIKSNGNQGITGQVMNSVLNGVLSSVDESMTQEAQNVDAKLTELSAENETIRTEVESQNQLIEDLQNTKIEKENDDYYPKMAVGLADNLAGVDVVDSEINFRRSGGGAITDGVARVHSIKGNSVVWNQLRKDGAFKAEEKSGVSLSLDGQCVVLNGTATSNITFLATKSSIIKGHHYLIQGGKSGEANYNFFDANLIAASGQNNTIFVAQGSGEPEMQRIYCANGITFNNYRIEPRLIDLTQMFGSGNEPTTIEEFYARIPMGVDLNAYNEGEVIHMNVQSIESQGVNAWDEEWENGSISSSTGQNVVYSDAIRNKGYIKVIPQKYFVKSPKNTIYVFGYDKDYNYIGLIKVNNSSNVGNQEIVIENNVSYIRFYLGGNGSYNHDICINISDTSINGKYYPYIKRVEDLAVIRKYFPQGMKSAGSAHDEIRYNKASGKWEKVVRIGEVDLGTLTWYYYADYGFYAPLTNEAMWHTANFLSALPYDKKVTPSSDELKQLDKVMMLGAPNIGDSWAKKVVIKDSAYTDTATFKAAMAGVILYYELAEPIITELDEADQFKDLDYAVWNAGTEKAIAEGKSAPLAADITYGFNAIGKIKELESLVAALRAKVGI